MFINQMIIPLNVYNRPNKTQNPKKICVHYTGNRYSTAEDNAKFYLNVGNGTFKNNDPSTWTSAHYIVGYDGECIQCIPDNYIGYSASGNNQDVIHIECCYIKKNGEFEIATIDTLRALVTMLMGKYKIAKSNVVRHYDLTGKLCPIYYAGKNNNEWVKLRNIITNTADSTSKKFWYVQAGAFRESEFAQMRAEMLKSNGYSAIVKYKPKTSMYHVQAGAFTERANAEKYGKEIESKLDIEVYVFYG